MQHYLWKDRRRHGKGTVEELPRIAGSLAHLRFQPTSCSGAFRCDGNRLEPAEPSWRTAATRIPTGSRTGSCLPVDAAWISMSTPPGVTCVEDTMSHDSVTPRDDFLLLRDDSGRLLVVDFWLEWECDPKIPSPRRRFVISIAETRNSCACSRLQPKSVRNPAFQESSRRKQVF